MPAAVPVSADEAVVATCDAADVAVFAIWDAALVAVEAICDSAVERVLMAVSILCRAGVR